MLTFSFRQRAPVDLAHASGGWVVMDVSAVIATNSGVTLQVRQNLGALSYTTPGRPAAEQYWLCVGARGFIAAYARDGRLSDIPTGRVSAILLGGLRTKAVADAVCLLLPGLLWPVIAQADH